MAGKALPGTEEGIFWPLEPFTGLANPLKRLPEVVGLDDAPLLDVMVPTAYPGQMRGCWIRTVARLVHQPALKVAKHPEETRDPGRLALDLEVP